LALPLSLTPGVAGCAVHGPGLTANIANETNRALSMILGQRPSVGIAR